MNYSLEKIAQIAGGHLLGPGEEYISRVITDSRGVFQTENSLFFALSGPNHDGHNYIPDLIKRGVKAFVIEESYRARLEGKSGYYIIVDDTLKALQQLAVYHRRTFSGKVIGITGSNGKTVVKEWLSQVLSAFTSTAKSPKSYNSQVGVPLSVMMMDQGPEFHILEAGISMPGEMEKLRKIIYPDVGILTNIGEAHQESFSSREAKLEEKLKLFADTRLIFYCSDQEVVDEKIRIKNNGNKHELFSWARNKEADLRIVGERIEEDYMLLEGLYKSGEIKLKVPFTDKASIENIIHIWAFCLYHGFSQDSLQDIVAGLEPVAMRMEQKEGIRGCTLINDFYNSDLNSLSISLDLLINQLPQERKTLIISELLQTGLTEGQLVQRINQLLTGKELFRVVGIGQFFLRNRSGFDFSMQAFVDTDDFLNNFPLDELRDEAILLKGARKFRFEKISGRIDKQSHKTVVEIRMNNLLHNLNSFRLELSPGTKLMAMVKASSYGSGKHEIAKFLAHQRVDYLGVAFIDEGVGLREAGVGIPIMVMNPDISGFDSLIENRLEPEIYSLEVLEEFKRAVARASLRKYPVHIKIDTGMHRLGFQPEQVHELIRFFKSRDELEIRSVFSHFTSADIADQDDYTHRQAGIFKECVNLLRSSLGRDFAGHICNTSAIRRFPEYHLDMVRLGIGLYGIDGMGDRGLKPVISMKTIISQIHDLKQGETVGYNNSQQIEADGRIAVIPVGYADGLDRRLGNGVGKFICNGSSVPTIGKICMDMTMLDISGIDAKTGEEVTIIGDGADISGMANSLDTITYEILTRIPQRVRRIYLFD